jgi:hypothetical protein
LITKKQNTMPTMKQVNEMIAALADEFDFSEREARIFLKLPTEVETSPSSSPKESKPRGRPPKSPSESSPKESKSPTQESKAKASKTSPTSTPRGPTAYNLFVKAEAAKVKAALEKSAPGGKLERGAVMKELGAKWKAMSEKQKEKYSN